ncbi:MAG TPA: hypothetical protein VMP42_00085 [Actinomycetota bacterium]|nr:hypothetical protein [Actinomycetota bacterium]
MARIAIPTPDAAEDARPAALTEALLPLLDEAGHRARLVRAGREDALDLTRTADLAVYQLADEPAFADVLRLSVLIPGVLVLHDLSLQRLVTSMLARGDPVAVRARREARAAAARLGQGSPGACWPAYPARRARGLVVASAEDRDLLRGGGCHTPAWVSSLDGGGASELVEAAEATLELIRDPVRGSIARWATALGEVGVSEEAAARGLGMRLPRALEGLADG